jgi:hypothetical protein
MVIEAPSASTKRSSPRARDHRLGAVDPALPSLLHPHAVVLDNKRAPLIGFTGTPIELQDADTRAVRQRVTHVARVPVDKVVLVAVRLVGNHHDVSNGCRSPFSSGKNLWMVVNTTPPAATDRSPRRCARVSACTGGWRRASLRLLAANHWRNRTSPHPNLQASGLPPIQQDIATIVSIVTAT